MINTMTINAVAHAGRLRVAPVTADRRPVQARSHLIAVLPLG